MIFKLIVVASTAVMAAPAMARQADQTDADSADIVVTGSAYRGEVASGGARINAKTKDLPLSISVVTEALIDDRQISNIRELADNVAGVRSRASGSNAFTIDFTIRGLQSYGDSISLNGFRVFDGGFDPQSVERVEFLKGPASVLYGASGALSGLVNVVTKTPRSDDFLNIDVTGGTPGYGRATVDANVRLSSTLDARFNGALTTETRPNTFQDVSAQFVSQSLRWRPLPGVSLLGEVSYFHSIQPPREDLHYPGYQRFLDLPKHFKLGEPFDRNTYNGTNVRVEATWAITDRLTLRQGLNIQDFTERSVTTTQSYSGGPVFSAPNIYERSTFRVDSSSRYVVSQSEARWSVDLGPTRHMLLAGFEYRKAPYTSNCCVISDAPALDLNNPIYGFSEPVVAQTNINGVISEVKGIYVQDFVELGRLKLLAGIRYDNARTKSYFCSTLNVGCAADGGDPVVSNLALLPESAFSPRAGLTWQPTERTTLFVSWSKSFNPNFSLDRSGAVLAAERGRQYEAGFRQDIGKPGRLTVSGSIFDIQRSNIAQADPADPNFSIAVGEQRVRGAELEVFGKPVDWLDLIGAYTYLDGKVTKSDPVTTGIAVGSRLPEAAPHSASLFAKAGFAPLGLRRLSLSAGVYYVSRRPSRDFFTGVVADPLVATLLYLPSSTRVDLGAYWDVSERFRLQANVTNVFDVKVYEPVNVGFNRTQPFRTTIGGRFSL